ncbi:6-phosphogluconate dehydrogenase [Emericellopsis atlantica]|uniref:6-phosphogluconate dehydrogenase n=1 Tax=Emericellopsis atlantica TaxID=2614577 RepID=A0A9P7ZRP3_9HYPO|nr:6-phosphogluconate dehydrogenase [Emericellopsis atlantica]KAG9256990.1 6-phosphogluconate dehydrogenase [Emericellopsis atlantica]
MASQSEKVPKVGILSLGSMGAGLARLLIAHGFPVATNVQGRSQDTIERARDTGAEILASDIELVEQCQVILSVLPPKDAEATAQRVIDALSGTKPKEDIYYIDLNAISPASTKALANLFEKARTPIKFIDGCILGGPPQQKSSGKEALLVSKTQNDDSDWIVPRMPISGPHSLASVPSGERLASLLNFRSISPEIGAASGLKMCFASMAKGYTALVTQSFTTAHSLGVAEALREEMQELMPTQLTALEKSVSDMVPKAYRWVREMEEIAATMSDAGGWSREMFEGAAGIFREVAANEVLKHEKTEKRSRGQTVDDVAALMSEGLAKKRKKME